MAVEITEQEANEIKIALNRSAWRNPDKTAMQIVLISIMMSLIMFSIGMIFWEAITSTLFRSIGIFSMLATIGLGLQIYSYSADTSGRGTY